MSCAHLHKACASFIARPSFVFMLVARETKAISESKLATRQAAVGSCDYTPSRGRSECDSSPRHFCEPYSRFFGLHLGCRKWQLAIGLARRRGFFSRKFHPVYPFAQGE